MEVIYSSEKLTTAIQKHLGNRRHGYFITLDTQHTTLNTGFNTKFLERMRDKRVFPFVYALNSYCYGRSFKRKQRMMRTVAAIEIGRHTQRLHAHLIMLHDSDSDTDRSLDDIRIRSHMIWRNMVPKAGANMIDVRQFDINKNWLPYITKGFTTFKWKYDFPSVGIH